jgi:hypothetical protein
VQGARGSSSSPWQLDRQEVGPAAQTALLNPKAGCPLYNAAQLSKIPPVKAVQHLPQGLNIVAAGSKSSALPCMTITGCYCGLRTRLNKCRWCSTAVLFLVGLIAIGLAIAELTKCDDPCKGDVRNPKLKVRVKGVQMYKCSDSTPGHGALPCGAERALDCAQVRSQQGLHC